jgi:hypothetical protein
MTGPACLFLQGTAQTAPFASGDGLACLGGSIALLATRPLSGGASFYPQPVNARISLIGGIPPGGGTFHYQCVYRNAAALFCPPATSNRTNAVVVTWAP